MFRTRFALAIAPNHVRLTGPRGALLEEQPVRPFSYGGKLVADREALSDLLQSMFKQALPRGYRRLFVVPVVDVEVAQLVGDDETALRAALEPVGVSAIHLNVTSAAKAAG